MNIFKILILVSSLLTFSHERSSSTFEGRITYEHLTPSSDGKLVLSKSLGRVSYFFKDSLYKHEYIGGDYDHFGKIIVNVNDTTRFRVDDVKKTVVSLGVENSYEPYLPKEVKLIHASDTILNYPCKKYELLQKDYISQGEKKVYVWVAEDLKFVNLPLLGKILGYRNSVIRDGSLGGIVLKYELRNFDGTPKLITKAIEVSPMQLPDETFLIPTNYFPER